MIGRTRRRVPDRAERRAAGFLAVFLALWRHPVALKAPQPLDPLAVHDPPLLAQERPDPPVPIAWMAFGELVDPSDEPQLELAGLNLISLRGAVLTDQLARPALRDREAVQQMRHRRPSPGRAHHFERCRSFSIEISSACSATIFFSRPFSCSRAFSRCASSSFNAPVLDPPPKERLIGNPQPLAPLRDREPLRLKLLRLPQLRDDLLNRIPLPGHPETPSGLSTPEPTTFKMDRYTGAGHSTYPKIAAQRKSSPDGSVHQRRDAVSGVDSSTFGEGVRLLPEGLGRDIRQLYYVLRTIDDLVDERQPEAPARLEAVERWASHGRPETEETRLLEDLASRHSFDRESWLEFCAGMRHDLAKANIQNEAELERYCQRAGGSVGVILAGLLGGHSDTARTGMATLGGAMQRTNILRDIDEDYAEGRSYIAATTIQRFGSPSVEWTRFRGQSRALVASRLSWS